MGERQVAGGPRAVWGWYLVSKHVSKTGAVISNGCAHVHCGRHQPSRPNTRAELFADAGETIATAVEAVWQFDAAGLAEAEREACVSRELPACKGQCPPGCVGLAFSEVAVMVLSLQPVPNPQAATARTRSCSSWAASTTANRARTSARPSATPPTQSTSPLSASTRTLLSRSKTRAPRQRSPAQPLPRPPPWPTPPLPRPRPPP